MVGIIAWGGFNWSLAATNTEAFCISCHEMEENVYEEYQHTGHYRNRTGVRATCPDCHVPREWHHMLTRKVSASYELVQKVRGTIDTREKFLAERPRMIDSVWASMRATDSRECRNCHDFSSMDLSRQPDRAASAHKNASQGGLTCIDCHIGVAHELPGSIVDREHKRFAAQNIDCRNCHAEIAGQPAADDEMWTW